jgi:hypothetical protein
VEETFRSQQQTFNLNDDQRLVMRKCANWFAGKYCGTKFLHVQLLAAALSQYEIAS